MPKSRRKPVFWRRSKPNPRFDIVKLRPASKPRGKRFESLRDAREESERSEELLRSFAGKGSDLADILAECRTGYYECQKPFCPICAGRFRRWFIGQLLRLTEGQSKRVHLYTVLLREAPRADIDNLEPGSFRHVLRKRLERTGLGGIPVIGGFEIVYRAAQRVWVLHANLIVFGGQEADHKKFMRLFKSSKIDRPVMKAALKDPPAQLSYVLKFGTYHRPHEQHGSTKSRAKPLNKREHAALVKWMSRFEFKDFLLMINAKRQDGSKIVLSSPRNAQINLRRPLAVS